MSAEIPAAARDAWRMLGEGFADLSWSRHITSSSVDGELGVGAVRTCRFEPNMFSNQGLVQETLLTFDPEAMELSYEARGLPSFVKRAINRWRIVPLGGESCLVESHATFELRGAWVLLAPVMRISLLRMGRQFIAELQQQVSAALAASSTA